jgi:hypothetical protein
VEVEGRVKGHAKARKREESATMNKRNYHVQSKEDVIPFTNLKMKTVGLPNGTYTTAWVLCIICVLSHHWALERPPFITFLVYVMLDVSHSSSYPGSMEFLPATKQDKKAVSLASHPSGCAQWNHGNDGRKC